jgi:uncharacterized membrane protein YhhN
LKSIYWVLVFFADAALHLISIIYYIPTLSLITKPLLMIILAGYFMSVVGNNKTKIKVFVLLALLGSWLGDTFLMFDRENEMFFILGLSSFLLAHIAYIMVFGKFERTVNSLVSFAISALFISYSVFLTYLLWAGLGEMKIPVILYALVLTIMGITGVVKNLQINNWIVVGVVLFIASDSLLAYTKFVGPISASRFLIMITYMLAQFFIVRGISLRITSRQVE